MPKNLEFRRIYGWEENGETRGCLNTVLSGFADLSTVLVGSCEIDWTNAILLSILSVPRVVLEDDEMEYFPCGETNSPGAVSEGIRNLLQSSDRINELDIKFNHFHYMQTLLPGLVAGLRGNGSLRHLRLQCPQALPIEFDWRLLCWGIQSSTSLESLSLSGVIGDQFSWALVLGAMEQNPSVDTLNLEFLSRLPSNPVVPIPNLQHLNISFLSGLSESCNFEEMLGTGQALRTLSIGNAELSEEQLDGLMRGVRTVPNLQELKLTGQVWDENSSRLLGQCLMSGRPSIQKLELKYNQQLDFAVSALVEIIQNNTTALENLCIVDPKPECLGSLFSALCQNQTIKILTLRLDGLGCHESLRFLPAHLSNWQCLEKFDCKAGPGLPESFYNALTEASCANNALLCMDFAESVAKRGDVDRKFVAGWVFAKRNCFKRLVQMEDVNSVLAVLPIALGSLKNEPSAVFLGLKQVCDLLPWSISGTTH